MADDQEPVTALRISATAHGINYLPEYFAAATGLFAREGITVANTARNPWTGVLDDLESGAADVALGGLWVPAMYAGAGKDLVAVAQLNARFPMVVVTRDHVEAFDWSWLKGKVALVPGAGGTAPYEFTAGLMREKGCDPAATRFARDLSTGMLVDLWRAGLGDAFIADLLTGLKLEAEGQGQVACRLATAGGIMPNSVYYVHRDRLDELAAPLGRFRAALSASMAVLDEGDARREALAVCALQWPDEDPAVLDTALGELMANGTWSSALVDPGACDRWTSILYDAGLLQAPVPHHQIVDASALDAPQSVA